jgi:hypothetical protein
MLPWKWTVWTRENHLMKKVDRLVLLLVKEGFDMHI